MRVLEVVDVHKEFGGIKALNGVSFEVNKGEVFFL
jgi:ABC-type branched-chain amino acid transport systems, ATPase component